MPTGARLKGDTLKLEVYYISAFYNKKEIERGERKVREWHDFFARHLQ